MSHDSDNETNLDYATGGASVVDIHDAVRRERSEPQSGSEPIGTGFLVMGAAVILLGAVHFGWHSENFSMSSIYKSAHYSPDPAPAVDGVVDEADQGPWIDTWLASGKKVYANCAACHQNSGKGAPGQFPPLVGVDYVNAGTERLAGILLHGINGALTVNGVTYNAAAMPAWSATLGDDKIAQVITYIRHEFGGLPPEEAVVTAESMEAAREKFSDRSAPYTESELLQMSPDAHLPGRDVDLLTGKPFGAAAAPADGADAAAVPAAPAAAADAPPAPAN